MLKITHDCGFFSCCSVRLWRITDYFNSNQKLPTDVDSSEQFSFYKNNEENGRDITFDFFKHYNDINIEIDFKRVNAFPVNEWAYNYKTLDYATLIPIVRKYNTPSTEIINIQNDLINEYQIETDNCIAIYYRGTDKYHDMILDDYDKYYNKLVELINEKESGNENIQIIIQTDTAQFLDYMKERNLKNVKIIVQNPTSSTTEGVHSMYRGNKNYNDMKYLMATFLILSKCKYIICSSSNCSYYMMLFRENANNIYQFKNNVLLQ